MAWLTQTQALKWASAIFLVLLTAAAHANELPELLTPYRGWVEVGGWIGSLGQLLLINIGDGNRRDVWSPSERYVKVAAKDDAELRR